MKLWTDYCAVCRRGIHWQRGMAGWQHDHVSAEPATAVVGGVTVEIGTRTDNHAAVRPDYRPGNDGS